MAYFLHPNPNIRKATLDNLNNIESALITQELADLLGDDDSGVRTSAAQAIWKQQKDKSCEYAVKILRDEIKYPSKKLGKDKAKSALELLIKEAPDEVARIMVKALIAEEIYHKYDEAIKLYDEAIKINSKYARAWRCKGNVLSETGLNAEAETAFSKAKELEPKLRHF